VQKTIYPSFVINKIESVASINFLMMKRTQKQDNFLRRWRWWLL